MADLIIDQLISDLSEFKSLSNYEEEQRVLKFAQFLIDVTIEHMKKVEAKDLTLTYSVIDTMNDVLALVTAVKVELEKTIKEE